MTDIVEFLTARLDEDEAAAKAAGVGSHDTWHIIEWYDGQFEGGLTVSVDVHGIAGAPITSRGALLRVDGEHVARHDPARVLAEVKAKRAIVALHGLETVSHQPAPYELPDGFAGEFVGYCQLCSDLDYPEGLDTYYEPWPCPSMRILASVYDQHPDYKQEWGVDA